MSCRAEPDPLESAGAISPAIVAGLAGLDPAQLERWRSEGLFPASISNDDPDREEFGEPPWYYSWNDHHRVLAAVKLLELDLPPAELPDALARLDAVCPRWATALVPRAMEEALPLGIDRSRFFAERWHEGPLGRLYAFAEVVEMRPGYSGGDPAIRGRRIRTAMLALEYPAASSAEALAETYRLTSHQVRRAIEFEDALHSAEQIHAPAAG